MDFNDVFLSPACMRSQSSRQEVDANLTQPAAVDILLLDRALCPAARRLGRRRTVSNAFPFVLVFPYIPLSAGRWRTPPRPRKIFSKRMDEPLLNETARQKILVVLDR